MTTSMPELLASKIPQHLERLAWGSEQVAAHQREALRRTLAHAMRNSPFHAGRLRGLDADRFELDQLASLPTMTKDDLMSHFDELLTDRRVTRAAVESALAATHDEPSLLFDEFMVLASGGSSGVRGCFVFDRDAASDYLLGGIRGSIARQLRQGSFGGGPLRFALVAATSAVHATKALPKLFSGGLFEIVTIPATIPLPQIVEKLEAVQPDNLQGYPSVIAMIADEKARGRCRISPRSITTSSEPLGSGLRERIEAAFGVPVCDQFGSSEGLMGCSEPGDDAIVMPGDLAIVELVDAEHRAVPVGCESSKVLLTTLYNPVQPLLRYELTDRMTACPAPEGSGHLRVRVSGRSDDLLRYGSISVHPHALRSVFVHTPAVREYQIRQTRVGVDVDVVPSAVAELETADLATRLGSAMARAGFADATVQVRVVDALPHDARSGKLRRIVPLPA